MYRHGSARPTARLLERFSTAIAVLTTASSLSCGAAREPVAPAPAGPPPKVAAPSVAALAPIATSQPAVRATTSLGQLDFPVSGSAECQRRFATGMLALHSFLYDEAHESFEAALSADPGCAMAAWGDAMTNDHPVWHERNVTKARAALARVTREESLTPKERAYLAAARALFAKDDAKEGHVAWLAAANAMRLDHPDDDEVALQDALALLALYGYDPKHVREQMEAGAIALAVLARRPEHPGAAHYAIHAFDSPDHAILALPAARTYARIAPAAGHAQHMPSHTFAHLGMWRDVVPSNERAFDASVSWEKAHGGNPSKYDWHSYSWLVAAHLELGHVTRARQLVEDARVLVVAAKDDDAAELRFDYMNLVAAYVTHSGRWAEAEALAEPVLAPALNEGTGGSGPVACAAHAPGASSEVRPPMALLARRVAHTLRIEAAIHLGQKDEAERRLADLRLVLRQMAPWVNLMGADFAARGEAQLTALTARAAGTKSPSPPKRAIEAIDAQVHIEEGRAIAGPAWLLPPRETYGEALAAWGRFGEALTQYERDLVERPGRAVALLGAARAAKAIGDLPRARARYAELAAQWESADAELPDLAEARAALK